jgi:hypothetical protein
MQKNIIMDTDSILKARDVYRDATVRFVDDNFHLFKLNDKVPTFEEMSVYVDRTRRTDIKPNKSERKWFIERVQTILRHEHSNYDEIIRQMPTKECGERFSYLVKKKIKDFSYKNYDYDWLSRAVA